MARIWPYMAPTPTLCWRMKRWRSFFNLVFDNYHKSVDGNAERPHCSSSSSISCGLTAVEYTYTAICYFKLQSLYVLGTLAMGGTDVRNNGAKEGYVGIST